MIEVLAVSTGFPDHSMAAVDAWRQLDAGLPDDASARMRRRLLRGSEDGSRHAVAPLRESAQATIEARNQAYRTYALRLGERVADEAMRAARVDRRDVGAVVAVSSTGYLMPTLDAHLIERLGLAPTCRRVPLLQLGCAGGVAGLGLSAALAGTMATQKILLVSVELPSLSFPAAAPSPTDVAATLQFGDGAAAAVLGQGDGASGPTVLATGSMLFPDTLDRDGVRLTAAGLRLMRPRGLADVLRRQLGVAVDAFLAQHDRQHGDISFWVIHPRNRQLLDAAATGLGLPPSAIEASSAVWRRRGNTISSAVFGVLEELRGTAPPSEGALGLLIAYGAGFSAEMVLLRAGGWLCMSRDRDEVVAAARESTAALA